MKPVKILKENKILKAWMEILEYLRKVFIKGTIKKSTNAQ